MGSGHKQVFTSTADDGSSASKQWLALSYGYGKWTCLSGSDRAIATSADAITWTVTEDKLPAGDQSRDWTGLTFGNGRFVAITRDSGESVICIGDPATSDWIASSNLPNSDGSTHMNWNRIRYANGVFIAVCDTGNRLMSDDAGGQTTGETTLAATSVDGVDWTTRDLTFNIKWSSASYGKSANTTSEWLLLARGGMMHIH